MADGKLVFDTKLNTDGIKNGLSNVGSVASKALGLTTKAVGSVSAGLSAGAIASVKFGSNFEAAMSGVAATMGMTSAEINSGSADYERLEQAAKDAGATTKFSASQAAEALNYMALAGYDVDESIATLPTVLNLAAAGGMDLATASDMVTDSMSALGDMAGTADSFVDKMAKTSQKSNTSVAQLGEAILTVGGTAKSMAGGVDEMNTVLGILADNGIKGAEGGTALRNMILSLSAPTDTASAKMEELGLSVFDAEGKMRPMNDIFNDLNGILSTMTEGEQTQVLNTIFNKVDLKSVNALLANSGERFDELSGYMADCDGAAANMADTMNNNLQGSVTILQSALEGLGISVYEQMEEPLKEAVKVGNGYIDELSAALKENGPDGLVAALGQILADIALRAAEFAPQLIELAVQLIKELAQGIIDNLPELIEAAGKIADAILDGIGDLCPALDPIIDAIKTLADNMDTLTPIVVSLTAAFVAWKVAISIVELINSVKAAMEGLTLAEKATELAQKLLNATMLANPFVLIVTLIAGLVAAFIYFWNTSESFRQFWIDLWENIKTFCSDAINAIISFFTESIPNGIESLKKSFAQWRDDMREHLELVKMEWTEKIQETIDAVVTFFSELPEKIAYWLGFCIGKIIKFGIDIVNWAITEMPKFVESVMKFFAELPIKSWIWLLSTISKVANFGSNLIEKGKHAGHNFVESLINFIKTTPNKILIWFLKTIDNVMQFKENLVKKAMEAGKGFVDKITEGLKGLPDQMRTIGKNIVDGIWKGISGGWKWLVDQVKGLANSLFQGAKDALDIHSPSKKFKWIGEMCVAGIDEPLEDYNPYDTLNKSMKMNAGIMTINHKYSASGIGSATRTDYTGMADAFVYALGRAGLTVKINNRDFGRVIREVVN
nr:MAG TPA: minor tail protein [Caudoviricetes sp.]